MHFLLASKIESSSDGDYFMMIQGKNVYGLTYNMSFIFNSFMRYLLFSPKIREKKILRDLLNFRPWRCVQSIDPESYNYIIYTCLLQLFRETGLCKAKDGDFFFFFFVAKNFKQGRGIARYRKPIYVVKFWITEGF